MSLFYSLFRSSKAPKTGATDLTAKQPSVFDASQTSHMAEQRQAQTDSQLLKLIPSALYKGLPQLTTNEKAVQPIYDVRDLFRKDTSTMFVELPQKI